MYRLLIDFCHEHPILLRHAPEFDLVLQCFSTLISAVSALEIQEFQVMTGRAVPTEQSRKTICALAAHIASLVEVYADDAQNDTLKETVNHSYHSLRRCSDKRLLKNCRDIHAAAVKYAVVLERYGLLKETFEVLSGAIEMFNAVVPPPKNARVLSIHYQKRFAFFLKEAGVLLRTRLDILAKSFMPKEKDFFTGYSDLRQLNKKTMVMPAA